MFKKSFVFSGFNMIHFIDKYIVKKVYGKPLPVPYTEVFTEDDKITPEERKLYRDN